MDEIFHIIDTDKNGTLDEEELGVYLSSVYGINPELVSSIITVYDDDKNRVIDKQEFLTLMTVLEEEGSLL